MIYRLFLLGFLSMCFSCQAQKQANQITFIFDKDSTYTYDLSRFRFHSSTDYSNGQFLYTIMRKSEKEPDLFNAEIVIPHINFKKGIWIFKYIPNSSSRAYTYSTIHDLYDYAYNVKGNLHITKIHKGIISGKLEFGVYQGTPEDYENIDDFYAEAKPKYRIEIKFKDIRYEIDE